MKQQFSNQYTAVVATLTKNKKSPFIYKKKNFNNKFLCQKVYLECLNTSTFFFSSCRNAGLNVLNCKNKWKR